MRCAIFAAALSSVVLIVATGVHAHTEAAVVPPKFASHQPATSADFKFDDDWVTVNTSYGPVTGYVNRFGGHSFRGVPFAAPPTGALRFAAPIVPGSWTTPRNATVFGPGCYAACRGKFANLMCPAVVSEDCLYLNVYAPTTPPPPGGFPVIMFIHGGMFTWGSGGIPLYDGGRWSTNDNVIIVTINYRLNIFGALFTGSTDANVNVLDQRMALKWIHDNIHVFNGDKTRVVLSGQSAGATSVGIHMVSPGSWPYFQRAAVISNPYGLIPPSRKMAQELGELAVIKLGCPLGGQPELDCLRKVPEATLLKMSEHTDFLPTPNEVLALFMQWSPFVDGTIIPGQPLQQMAVGAFNAVPMMIGTVANETIPFIFGINFEVPSWMMDVAIDYVFGISKGTQIELLYGPVPAANASDARYFFSRLFTDYSFYCPTRFSAKMHNQYLAPKGLKTYVWFFDEHPSWAMWYAGGNAENPCVRWICHAFDLPTIFATYYELPSGFPHPTPGEMQMSTFVQTSWAHFAATGEIENWPAFSPATNLTAYNISYPLPTAPLQAYRAEYCDYFDSIGYNRW